MIRTLIFLICTIAFPALSHAKISICNHRSGDVALVVSTQSGASIFTGSSGVFETSGWYTLDSGKCITPVAGVGASQAYVTIFDLQRGWFGGKKVEPIGSDLTVLEQDGVRWIGLQKPSLSRANRSTLCVTTSRKDFSRRERPTQGSTQCPSGFESVRVSFWMNGPHDSYLNKTLHSVAIIGRSTVSVVEEKNYRR